MRSGLGAVGGLFGPIGSSVADKGAMWLSDVLGMGDYEVKENSLMNAQSGVPSFASSKHSIRIRHRECLGDITGSTLFSNKAYVINPGLESTFPWLSGVAENFQQYKFHGLLFEFVSTSAVALNNVNTALGTVILGTNYNAARSNFVNKIEMEAYEFSCSTPPSRSLIHPVECNPQEQPTQLLYVRGGALPAGEPQQFYDHGKFQLATVGMQAASTIGELWVSYDIELLKPRLYSGGSYPGEIFSVNNGPYSATNTLGTIQRASTGSIPITVGGSGAFDTLTWDPSIQAGRYHVTVYWKSSVANAITIPNVVLTNGTAVSAWSLDSAIDIFSPVTGVTTAVLTYNLIFDINGYSASGTTLRFSAGTLPTVANAVSVDVLVTSIPLVDQPI